MHLQQPVGVLEGMLGRCFVVLLLALLTLGVGCADSEGPEEEQADHSPPLLDYGELTFSDGTRVRIEVTGRLPPPCDPDLGFTLDAASLRCVDGECDFAEFALEERNIALARTQGGIVIDPQLYELELFVTPEDCLDDNP